MTSKVTDFLQGVRNCPPNIIPYHCSNCSVQDGRGDRFRDPRKPRCAEPNFAGRAVLEGVNDKGGFNHENILIALHPSSSPPFYCVCGKYEFAITFSQIDKWHFPQVVLACRCGRSKTIIVHANRIDLTGAWVGQKTHGSEGELPQDLRATMGSPIVCNCKKKLLMLFYERGGLAFFPREGETILIGCNRCKRAKKVILRADIDASEPWICMETVRRKSLMLVRTSTDMCPDIPNTDETERVFVVPLTKE